MGKDQIEGESLVEFMSFHTKELHKGEEVSFTYTDDYLTCSVCSSRITLRPVKVYKQ